MANGDAPEEDPKEQLPEGASEVLYVNNLNEKIKLPSAAPPSCPSLQLPA